MKLACGTIVFNEKFWFPIWLNYYKSITPHIFVIDNGCTDGTLDGFDGKKISMPSKYLFSNVFLKNTVNKLVKTLLADGFDAVIFAEVDEFIFNKSDSILNLIKSNKASYFYARGYNLIHTQNEKELDITKPLLPQRKYWKKAPGFSKPCIQKHFHPYSMGLHRLAIHTHLMMAEMDAHATNDLYLVHAHYIDRKVQSNRHVVRYNAKPPNPSHIINPNCRPLNEMLIFMDEKCSPPYEEIPSFVFNKLLL